MLQLDCMDTSAATTQAPSQPRAVVLDPGLPGRLLRQFDSYVPKVSALLVERYGEVMSAQLLKDARAEYAALIPRLPYVGGRKNPHGLRQRAERSQLRVYPGDFVFQFIDGAGKGFDFGVDYTECAIVKFLRAEGAAELAPQLCQLDAPMCRALGIGLRRTGTLAAGALRCDFRFSRSDRTVCLE